MTIGQRLALGAVRVSHSGLGLAKRILGQAHSKPKPATASPVQGRAEVGEESVSWGDLFTKHTKVGIFHSYRKLLHQSDRKPRWSI